jgi:glycosyltransferase involved in cell wall biosynthesis
MADRLSWVFHVDSVPMTRAVVAGETSLGGSESACLGLARALRCRGHDVTVFATRMADDVPETDADGVRWMPAEMLREAQKLIDPDVFVALRQPHVFGLPVQARYRILWNQDMLVGDGAKQITMSLAWAYDRIAYVSQYQRKQWEGVCAEIAPLGWVTRNGFDPAMVPTDVERVKNRIIHISRPERAMTPLLAMWPELKKRVPDAELHVCRYASMYDGEGSQVKAMVEAFDAEIARVHAEVGGIVQLGHLNKRDLYRAIASASVMWYPGVVDFAETSCIAAIEAQACGTPFVGSYKGALPETAPHGWFTSGDAMSAEYQAQSIDDVQLILEGTDDEYDVALYAHRVKQSLSHVASYTYDAIAAEWESSIWAAFDERSQSAPERVVEALLHEDDVCAALALTTDHATIEDCGRVIRGEEQTAEHYGKFALDPEKEMTTHKQGRHLAVVDAFKDCEHILDLACGNGAFALLLAEASPTRRVVGVDYSEQNVEVARSAAERHGLSDRVTFHCRTLCSLETGAIDAAAIPLSDRFTYDGVFLGEFCEHVAGVDRLLNDVSALVGDGALVVVTVPSGPFSEMLPVDMTKQRGHVHHFRPRDLSEMFAGQDGYTVDYLTVGMSPRGAPLGHWLVRYRTSQTPINTRPYQHWARTIRPQARLSVGILAHNATNDLTKCLASVWPIADEIIVADTGSDDRAELERMCARFRATLITIPSVQSLEGGFSQARNYTMDAASGEWFLWIDPDEELLGNGGVHKYLESGVFRGYAIKQNHLMLDCPVHADTPVRLFRRAEDVEFYGVVHEQPQQGDCNGDIMPALQLHDVQIAHTGYLHEGIRRHKSMHRNLPLLMRDRQVFPSRLLGVVLVIRDLVTQASWRIEQQQGQPDAAVWRMWQQAIGLFEEYFLDPTHRLHDLARPFYEQAVRHVRGAIEVETSLGGAVQGLRDRHAEKRRFWVRTPSQIKPLLDHYQAQALKVYEPTTIDVEPWVPVPERESVVA